MDGPAVLSTDDEAVKERERCDYEGQRITMKMAK